MVFLGYSKCSTSNKAQKLLDGNDIKYEFRDIKTDNPSYDELKKWQSSSGRELKSFFNTSGLIYKELKLKDKLSSMSENEQFELLSTNGMLVKRPMLIGDDFILVGFKEAEWKEKLSIGE